MIMTQHDYNALYHLMVFGIIKSFVGVSAYWLMSANNVLTIQRIDPIMDPNRVTTHVHAVIGGSNFGLNTSTASLRASECTSIPIPQDKSNYWFPLLYFQWANGSFTSVEGSAVICTPTDKITPHPYHSHVISSDYLFSEVPETTTAFPDDFRMISGDYTLRTYDETSYAQQALTYLCLNFEGVSSRHNELPIGRCPSGIRSQINFPSCWDGKNTDSSDHRSHVSFLSTGPDSGKCEDPAYPITLPRIFLEVYWYSQTFDDFRNQAARPEQPFVFSNGDPTGYGFHADFFTGWEEGVLQRVLNECNCNPYGDPTCCIDKGIFTMNTTQHCYISDTVLELTTGTLPNLPGPNPIQSSCYEEYYAESTPALLNPVFVHMESTSAAPATGTISIPAVTKVDGLRQNAKGTCIVNVPGTGSDRGGNGNGAFSTSRMLGGGGESRVWVFIMNTMCLSLVVVVVFLARL